MSGPVVWMAAFFTPPLCLICLWIANCAIKISKVEAEKSATKHFEDVTTKEALKEPKCSTILCAFIGTTIFSQDTSLFTYNRTPFEWSSLLWPCTLGLMAGNMAVKILNFMKRKDRMSRDWVWVSLLIPLMSFGFLLLKCIENSCDFVEQIVRSSWICVSALFVLLGGYAAVHFNSDYPKLPLHSNYLEEPIAITKRYVICAVSLAIIYLGSLYSLLWVMSIWETSSKIESGILLALASLLILTFLYAFLVFCHMVLICSRLVGCYWWAAFFCLAVPCGLGTLVFDGTSSFTTMMMIDSFISMIKVGTLGPLMLFVFYPILFKMQALPDAGASGSCVVVADSPSMEEVRALK